MSTVDELIAKQRATNTPEAPRKSTPLQQRIERAKAAIEARWEAVQVTLGGETLDVEIGKISGKVWVNIADHHPPTTQADLELGYDRDTLPNDYPADRIKLAGEPTTTEQWRAVYGLLDPEDIKNIQAVIWWLNIGEPKAELARLTAEKAERDARAG